MEKILSDKLMKFKDMAKVAEPVVNVNSVSRISEGTVLKGDMSSVCDIRVDGKVEGKLYSKGKIVVGESASLVGHLLCNTVDLWGSMDGDIYVRDVLSVKSSAVINGNINVRKFQVEMGAQINGTIKMITEEEFDQCCASIVTAQLPVQNTTTLSRKLFKKEEEAAE